MKKPTMRERILNAASALFFGKGFSQVKINEIAEYIGISKKTIYNHFDNKQELMAEASHQWLEDMLETLNNKAASDAPFIDKLKDILATAAACLADAEKLKTNSPPAIMEMLIPPVKERIIQITETLLIEGRDQEIFRRDLPADILPPLYLSIIESFIVMKQEGSLQQPAEKLMEITEKVLLEGLYTEKGRRSIA